MKVLLINPWQSEVFPPPSLGYLQAVLCKEGIEVKACDYAEALLEDDMYDIVAVTFHSFSVRNAIVIRNKFKGRLICGGHHPSALPQQMLDIGYNQVVIGEGEQAIIDIVNGNTDSIIYGCPSNLDDLPFPDYTGFKGNWSMGLPVISSRGCPFDCSFCASADFWKRKWKMRSAENVVAEIVATGYKTFMFEDDNFTLHRARVLEICSMLRDIGGFSWQCASRAETLIDSELCWNLSSAGCHTVWLGVESLSQESLNRCHKNTTVEKMISGIKIAHTYRLNTLSQFIVGIPDDTERNIRETVSSIKQNKIGRKGVNIMWVLPNTEIHKRAKERGFDDTYYLRNTSLYYTYEQSMKTLEYWSHLIKVA